MRRRIIPALALLCLPAGLAFAQEQWCRPIGDGTTYTTVALTSSVASPSSCQSVTFTALISTNDGTGSDSLTGTMIFYDGTAILGSVPVSAGSASYTTSSLTAGNHNIQAQYVPDQAYLGGSSTQIVQTVSGSTTTVTLASTPNPSNPGQAVAFTVRVVAAATCQGAPTAAITGTVSFFDGTAQIGQSNVLSGIATLQISTLAAGSHALNARYSGDMNYTANTSSSVTQVVSGNPGTTTTPASTTTTLATSANPISTTQSLTLTAGVTPSGATGQVQFRDGATTIGTVTLTGGAASFTASNLAAGTHSLTAVYVGGTNFNQSTSNTVNETVTAPSSSPSPLSGSSSTALSVSPNPASTGQTVTLSATVTPSNALGGVLFLDGATPIGQGNLVNGTATLQVSTFTAGSHTLTGLYLGDAATPPHPQSTSSPVTLMVTVNNGKQNTTTTLTGSTDLITSSQSLTLKAFVTPAGATGDVQFTDSGSPLSIVSLANGVATLIISTLSIGSHSLAATYMGDANFNPSTSSPAGGSPAIGSQTALAVFQVEGGAGPANAAGLKVTVLPVPSVSISVLTPSSTADQPVPRVTLSPAYTLPLTAKFTLSFTPSRPNLPEGYTNPDVKFIGGSVTSEPISIPADSSEPVWLPAVQLGTVAGTITVKLAALTTSTGLSVLPDTPPAATITVGKFVPSIVPGSVRIVKNTASGLSVLLDASATACDLSSANLTFQAASGARSDTTVSLTVPAASWLPGTAADCGVADGGAFSLAIPFLYSVDTTAIGSISVSLTNSAGTSPAVSGEVHGTRVRPELGGRSRP
jgi:hypothetical protein